MNRITLGKLFELYYDIFNVFGFHLLKESDEMVAYYIFDVTAISIGYCSKRILTKFLEEGIIDEIILEKSSVLLNNFRKLESTVSFQNVKSIRSSLEWKELMKLSSEIKNLIKTRWTDEELQAIFEFNQSTGLSN